MSLSRRIENYFREWYDIDPQKFIHKGEIEDMAKEKGYLGETSGRVLRALVEKGKLESYKVGKSKKYRHTGKIDVREGIDRESAIMQKEREERGKILTLDL